MLKAVPPEIIYSCKATIADDSIEGFTQINEAFTTQAIELQLLDALMITTDTEIALIRVLLY